MAELSIFQLWTVAAVLFGFQLAALTWRLNRELDMASRHERIWIPYPDRMVYLSVLILVGGVFIAPFLGNLPLRWAVWLFGLALVIFAATPPVLAGHYDMYRYTAWVNGRPLVTPQEKKALFVVWLLIGAYFVAGLVLLCWRG